jgi:hypothetical protein
VKNLALVPLGHIRRNGPMALGFGDISRIYNGESVFSEI